MSNFILTDKGQTYYEELRESPFTSEDMPVTIFVVAIVDAGFATQDVIVSMTSITDADTLEEFDANATTPNYRYLKRDDGGALKLATGGVPDANPHILVSVSTGTTVSMYEDAVLIGAAGQDVDVGTLDVDRVNIGIRRLAAIFSNFFDGDIAEILMYDSALSDADRILVQDLLNTKYATF